MKETAITAKLIQKLNTIPMCHARKRHGSAYMAGDPDVCICYKGQTILIEMKLLAGELSDLQAVMLQRWQDAGAMLGKIRKLVALNLTLGIITVSVAVIGLTWN